VVKTYELSPAVSFKGSCPDPEPGQTKLAIYYHFPARPDRIKAEGQAREPGGWNLKIVSRCLPGRVLAINGNLV